MRSFVVVALLIASLALALPPVPSTYDGISRGDVNAQITVEGFLDLMCPGCKAAHPVFSTLATEIPQVKVITHLFPLPYHRNAFVAAQASRIVETLKGAEAAWKFNELFFQNQDSFSNGATANSTANEVVSKIADLAVKLSIDRDEFLSKLQYGTDSDGSTRVSWKFGCSRAVYGTPTFHVNGVPVDADPMWTVADWKKFLEPLLSNNMQ